MDFREYTDVRDGAEIVILSAPRSAFRRIVAKQQFSLREEN